MRRPSENSKVESRLRGLLPRILGAVWLFFPSAGAFAQEGPEPPKNPFVSWLWVALGLGVIWFLFYKGLYPYLRRYYRAEACQRFFWIQFLLFASTWLHLSTYVFFEYGFYWLWIRWVAAFLGVLFLIWFILAYLRRSHA